MKKELKVLLSFVLLIFFISCKIDNEKFYYCLSKDNCITVWKKSDGNVYIIPSRYSSNIEPDVSYIKTIDKQFLTLYFSKKLPNKIIVRNEGNLISDKKMFSIINKDNGNWKFEEFSSENKKILYQKNASKFKNVKKDTDFLIINIHENYAIDKMGKKIIGKH